MAEDDSADHDTPDLTVEEYLTWYTPKEVLDALPSNWTWETKVRLIAQSMEDGELRSVADRLVTEHQKVSRFELPKQIWKHWACLVDFDFWNAGLRAVYSDQRDYNGAGFTAYRVRLEPLGAASLAPGQMNLPSRGEASAPRPVPKAMTPKRDKPTKEELLAWVRQFGTANPGASFKVFLSNARFNWPTLHVSEMPVKQAIAELDMTLSPGNPKITRKNRRFGTQQ